MSRLDYQPLFGKGARAPPRTHGWTRGLRYKTSACLNQAGCINYHSRGSKEVVQYEERSC